MSVFLTPEIADIIANLVSDYHVAVAASVNGQDAVTAEQWDRAIELGIVDPQSSDPSVMEQLHIFGLMLGHEDQAQWQDRYGQTTTEFIDEIARNPVPMTTVEHKSGQFARRQSAAYIVGLGNKVGARLNNRLIEADKDLDREMRSTIQDVVSAKFGDSEASSRMKQRGIDKDLGEDFFDNAFRSTAKEMVSDMGHATGDWARDFDRIAQTESERVMQDGLKESWKSQEEALADKNETPVHRIVVYKIPKPSACKNCVRLHLEGGVPRLFYLDELEGNGTNVGRKAASWEVVVGPIHPYCSCSLVKLPKFMDLPKDWTSGSSAPKVVGAGGRLVLTDDD